MTYYDDEIIAIQNMCSDSQSLQDLEAASRALNSLICDLKFNEITSFGKNIGPPSDTSDLDYDEWLSIKGDVDYQARKDGEE